MSASHATEAAPPSGLTFASVEPIGADDPAAFRRAARHAPVVVDGKALWSRWDVDVVDLLKQHHGAQPIAAFRTIYGDLTQVERRGAQREPELVRRIGEEWTLADYLEAARTRPLPVYLANLALRDLPQLERHYRAPRLSGQNLMSWFESATAPELFVGAAHSQYGALHIDGNGGSVWCLCLTGEKEWVVFPPSDSELLLPHRDPGEIQLRHSFLNPWDAETLFPYELEKLHPIKVRLKAGQALFLPPNWWHITRNNTLTVTINERVWPWSSFGHVVRLLLRRCQALLTAGR